MLKNAGWRCASPPGTGRSPLFHWILPCFNMVIPLSSILVIDWSWQKWLLCKETADRLKSPPVKGYRRPEVIRMSKTKRDTSWRKDYCSSVWLFFPGASASPVRYILMMISVHGRRGGHFTVHHVPASIQECMIRWPAWADHQPR